MGTPLRRAMQVHEALQSTPSGYTLTGAASPDTVLSLRVALVQNNIDGLIEALYDVSTPSSSNYGKWLSKSDVEAYTAPESETVDAVNSWLSENGLNATVLTPAGDWLGIDVPVSKANEILATDFSVFTSSVTGATTIRTLSYSLPSNLIGHVALVHPTITFPNPSGIKPPIARQVSTPAASASDLSDPCAIVKLNGTAMTPACLQELYGIPATPATVASNGLAVAEYEYEYAEESDLHAGTFDQTFLQTYRPDVNPNTNFTVLSIDNGTNPQSPDDAGLEASLDLQYTVGIATNVNTTFITVGYNGDFLTNLLDTANTLIALDSPPQVVSTSYGEDEQYVSASFATTLCNAYAQLGARGVSLIFSSGDGGVSGNHFEECTTFNPTFPSVCPHITTVGATTLIPEVAVDFSGGGFSNIFPRPSYQDAAVSAYLTLLGSNDTGLYNASGRGYPDVSAQGVDFEVVNAGEVLQVSGTSCSAPTFASVVALLNDRLLASGKPTLGFLNPFLYSTGASAFNDITSGNNTACGTNGTLGFFTAPGWDPVSGLGTPDFAKLLTAVGL
ncbi:hypothetical protein IEO21_05741 [Rhodonia placenta]|uniref:tripeptidyl-peptidase II n=1 Tax=Rhodonia placenta TaxID=104341 RepID=A0A8H7P1T3_9APHY|nr:hypothetical protein IEO21_05741 [Postia placenta]